MLGLAADVSVDGDGEAVTFDCVVVFVVAAFVVTFVVLLLSCIWVGVSMVGVLQPAAPTVPRSTSTTANTANLCIFSPY